MITPGGEPLIINVSFDHRVNNVMSAVRQGLILFGLTVTPKDRIGAIVLRDVADPTDQYGIHRSHALNLLPTDERDYNWDTTTTAIELALDHEWEVKEMGRHDSWDSGTFENYEVHTSKGTKEISCQIQVYEIKLERRDLTSLVGEVDFEKKKEDEST